MLWNSQETEDYFAKLTHEIELLKNAILKLSCKEVPIKGLADFETNIDRLFTVLEIAVADVQKVDQYINNLDKYNSMVNELKGCVSLARSAVMDRKQADSDLSLKIDQLMYHVEHLLQEYDKKTIFLDKITEKFAKIVQDFHEKCHETRKLVKKKIPRNALHLEI